MFTLRHPRARNSRRPWPMLANALLATLAATFSMYGVAQITSGGGSERQEGRQSDSTSRADPSGVAMHESQRPQSKDAARGRAPSAGKDHKPEGSGGFDNGLYGTGAGNNK
ncbi:beta-xylosidase [Caballeronia ptereochthonis]|uniref:Beta-xylosidase n=1 Tax=Caballeronia ptereochthonis TaxID=1777144 RepID=A0A158D381_9BURK|nr:beta-xylosidase [Caballeronia ptereochthonis]SAK88696.1 hypothetical protein AWB83_04974 [Caballeronia ptereochthonis]